MVLKFRNIDTTPDDPVRDWGVEGMTAALDRGGLDDWSKLARAVVEEPFLEATLENAIGDAETGSAAAYVRLLIKHLRRTPSQVALDRLRDAFYRTQLTQGEAAALLGTSRSRLNTYLTGGVTPSMDILVAMEQLADERTRYQRAARLVLEY